MTGATKAAEPVAVEPVATTTDDAQVAPTAAKPKRQPWPYWVPAAVVVVGLVVTVVLALVSNAQYNNNEKRLLGLRVKEVGALLASAQPNTQIPLASAAALADATNGDVAKFKNFVAQYVGPRPSHQFVSASLWRVGDPEAGPLAVVGQSPSLTASTPIGRSFFMRASRTPKLSVIGIRRPALVGIGSAFRTPEPTSRYIAYAETALPPNRRSRFEKNAAFSDLSYAVYLGNSEQGRDLLVTSLKTLPVRGQQARIAIPYGDTVLTLVVAPRQSLAGTLPQRLPWIIVIVGTIMSLSLGALMVRLVQRRMAAEDLAGRLEHAVGENQRLYAEQRSIAQTLQHALLPEDLPQLPGIQASARYEPGEQGVDIGGDWYDVIPTGEQRLLIVVGDVSGRGLRAAATMASLRYAIHAYAAQNDSPAAILAKLSKLLNVTSSGQLATVLCCSVDVGSRELTVTSAGHLPPLLIDGEHSEFIESEIGLPVGVQENAGYVSKTVTAPLAATFLAFTDGLVERRGENLDSGLARLQHAATAATANHLGLSELLTKLVMELRQGHSDDDTAIVGLRWTE